MYKEFNIEGKLFNFNRILRNRDSSNSQVYRFLVVNMVNPEKKNIYARKKAGIRTAIPSFLTVEYDPRHRKMAAFKKESNISKERGRISAKSCVARGTRHYVKDAVGVPRATGRRIASLGQDINLD